MKKLFLVCLMMLAGSAWAKWVMYEGSEEATFYFDPATIRKDGNMRRVWSVSNLRERKIDGTMSYRMRNEYDCKQERHRLLSVSTHSEPMAGGKVLVTAGEYEWEEVAPMTISEKLLKMVCNPFGKFAN